MGTLGPGFARAGPPDSPDYPRRGGAFKSKTHRLQPARGVARSAGPGPAPMNKGALAVSVDAMSPELTAALAAPRLTWVLRFGRVACLTTDLACTGGGIVLTCG
jgi:hypothetical protein